MQYIANHHRLDYKYRNSKKSQYYYFKANILLGYRNDNV